MLQTKSECGTMSNIIYLMMLPNSLDCGFMFLTDWVQRNKSKCIFVVNNGLLLSSVILTSFCFLNSLHCVSFAPFLF